MSTKTITKRVALATVVALGAGVLSLVSVTSANATIVTTVGGIPLPTAVNAANGSVGLLASADNGGTPDQLTATVLSTGALKLSIPAGQGGYYAVSAGGVISADSAGQNVNTLGISQTTDSVTVAASILTITPTGAAGSTFTITGSTSSTGSVVAVMVVTIAGASVSGVASVSKSAIYWSGLSTNGNAMTSDVSTASATTTGLPLYMQVALKDAYGAALTSGTGALTVTATAGANVSIGLAGSSNTTSGTYSTAVSSAVPADLVVKVTEATPGAGWSGSLTVTYNGVVLATKSGTITGLPSKIVGAAVAVGQTNATVDTAVSYQVYDAAGNVVVVAPASITLNASANTTAVTNVAAASGGATYASNSSTGPGYLKVVGGTTAGSSALTLTYTRSDGAAVVSNSFNVLVGGAAATYTATLDKSKYAPGDIATMKIKFLDSKGNPAASNSSLYTIGGSSANYTWNASFALPQLTQIGNAGTVGAAGSNAYDATSNVAPDAAGVITLKYTVGTTSGSFNAIVDFPTVDAAGGAAQAIAYAVADGSTSLNDVLKGIVSLIASINKQIAALAKLVTKK